MASQGNGVAVDEETCIKASRAAGVGWDSIPSHVPNAPACVEECEKQFLQRFVPEYDETNLAPACERLTEENSTDNDPALWELYCCNSAVCGVLISDASEELRHSPSARSIIDRCYNLGFRSIQNPGVPPMTYSCPAHATSRTQDGMPCQKPESSLNNPIEIANLPTGTGETRVPSSLHTPTSTLGDSEAAANANQELDEPPGNEGSAGLSAGVKAAVIVCSVLGVVTILGLLLWCLHRKRFRNHQFLRDIWRRFKLQGAQPAGSPVSILLPTGTVTRQPATPLTPPPRLGERKLLPLILASSRPETDDGPGTIIGRPYTPTPRGRGYSSPLSLSRSKSDGTFHKGGHLSKVHKARLPSLDNQTAVARKTASLSSSASNRTMTTLAGSTNADSATAMPAATSLVTTPPVSPHRLRRLHETPNQVPDLVRQGTDRGHGPGPPPNRALPPAPPLASASASASVSASASAASLALMQSQSHHQPQPVAQDHGAVRNSIGNADGNAAQGLALELEQESQDFREHTERYGRESRGSWGSWGGSGGGAPGVVSLSPQRAASGGGASMNSPVLEETDLEMLGGCYRGI